MFSKKCSNIGTVSVYRLLPARANLLQECKLFCNNIGNFHVVLSSRDYCTICSVDKSSKATPRKMSLAFVNSLFPFSSLFSLSLFLSSVGEASMTAVTANAANHNYANNRITSRLVFYSNRVSRVVKRICLTMRTYDRVCLCVAMHWPRYWKNFRVNDSGICNEN